tara:strand:+ start:156 stop:914 length:759 start_codon:yes stop_codon:yes gene_type:complete
MPSNKKSKPIAIFLGSGGHLGPKVINDLLNTYNIIGISRTAETIINHVGYKGINFDFEQTNEKSIKKLIKKIFLENGTNISGFIVSFYYGYPKNPNDLSDESIIRACMGIFGRQMQIINAIAQECNSNISIILISSMYANLSPKYDIYEEEQDFNALLYGSMKSALERGGKWFVAFNQKNNLRINVLRLGAFPNNSVQINKPKFIKALEDQTIPKRIGKPKDISGAIEFLLSDKSEYCQGSTITIDGGWTIT